MTRLGQLQNGKERCVVAEPRLRLLDEFTPP